MTLNEVSCPACEYERGTVGNTMVTRGLAKCMDCGASWREISDHVTPGMETSVSTAKAPLEKKVFKASVVTSAARKPLFENAELPKSKPKPRIVDLEPGHPITDEDSDGIIGGGFAFRLSHSNIMAAVCFCMLGLGVASILPGFKPDLDYATTASIEPSDPVTLGDIQVKQRQSGRDGKVVTVRGRISNISQEVQPLSGIFVTLNGADGSSVLNWRHRSNRSQISPGEVLWFSTSVPVGPVEITGAQASFQ